MSTCGPASVHPHARGERWQRRRPCCRSCGSSPRTWGTPGLIRGDRLGRRFIPTHVGNAATLTRRSSLQTVHPHARGERCCAHRLASIPAGSSPRTWGTRDGWGTALKPARFIPTHVGNASILLTIASADSVHPHARGERPARPVTVSWGAGSSPRTWGTRRLSTRQFPLLRFIPTHVGNAQTQSAHAVAVPVHPHARGERFTLDSTASRKPGSSPRTWGTQSPNHCGPDGRRFIPTHVGNASMRRMHSSGATVHPHARGERVSAGAQHRRKHGSSPRTWGTQRQAIRYRCGKRFIPTHVGNAGLLLRAQATAAVHPHARGERNASAKHYRSNSGSSPRTWGTHFPQPVDFIREKSTTRIYQQMRAIQRWFHSAGSPATAG